MYFLREFVDCFAWTNAKMLGLDSEITVHKLNIPKLLYFFNLLHDLRLSTPLIYWFEGPKCEGPYVIDKVYSNDAYAVLTV